MKNVCILVRNAGSGQWLVSPSSAVLGIFCDEILDDNYCYEFSSDSGGSCVLCLCYLLPLHGGRFNLSTPSSCINFQSQIASTIGFANAIYYDYIEESATDYCFLLPQEMTLQV